MANVLGREKREQVLALGRLGWTLRRIEAETGVRRETASTYLKAAWNAAYGQSAAKGKARRRQSLRHPRLMQTVQPRMEPRY